MVIASNDTLTITFSFGTDSGSWVAQGKTIALAITSATGDSIDAGCVYVGKFSIPASIHRESLAMRIAQRSLLPLPGTQSNREALTRKDGVTGGHQSCPAGYTVPEEVGYVRRPFRGHAGNCES